MDPKRGEVWWADLGKPTGHEQAYRHVVVVVQNDAFGSLSTVVIVPTTTKLERGGRKGTVRLPAGEAGLSKEAVILCHEIRALDRKRLLTLRGKVSETLLSDIDATLAYALGLGV